MLLGMWTGLARAAPLPEPTGDIATEPETEPEATTEPEGDVATDPEAAPETATGPEGDAAIDREADVTDPLGVIEAALDELARAGVRVEARTRTQNVLQGETLSAEVTTDDPDLLRYVLERAVEDGFQIFLEPTDVDRFTVTARRARAGQGSALDYVDVDEVVITGAFRPDENEATLHEFAGLPPSGVVPNAVVERLANIGYRAVLHAAGPGRLRIHVEPGRTIRSIRVRGFVPLPQREVRQVLSPAARPGALAWGRCSARPLTRKTLEDSVCEADDLSCQQWERGEIERLRRYLFDQGYLRGDARLGLACGKAPGEADLVVQLRKGRAFRVRRVVVTGNVSTGDQRWIRRVFRPTVGPFLPIPKRLTRAHIESAKERVAREYAEPRGALSSTARRQLELPYPGIRIDTSFDDLTRGELPNGHRLTLSVDVQLGHGVETAFVGNRRVTESRLRAQLSVFERREAATAAAALREAENLRAYYQSRGYMLAAVRGSFRDFGARKQLSFEIEEGPRVRVADVALVISETVPNAVRTEILRDHERGRELSNWTDRFTDAKARKDLAALVTAFNERGYLCARAQMRIAFWREGLDDPNGSVVIDLASELDGTGEPTWLERQLGERGLAALRAQDDARVHVRIEVDAGPRVVTSGQEIVRNLELRIPGSREVEGIPVTASGGAWGAPRMLRDGPLRRRGDDRAGGIALDLSLDRDVEADIRRRYHRSGYPLADVEVRWVYTDTRGTIHRTAQAERLTTEQVGLCREQAGRRLATVDTELLVYEGRRGSFGATLLRGNFKTRRYVLEREITWREGQTYDQSELDATRRNLEGTGTVEAVRIRPQPTGCDHTDDPEQPCVVHEVVTVSESKDRAMDIAFGGGFATLDPFYVFVRPTFPNIAGTGWDLRLDAHFGTGFGARQFCGGEDCYDRSGRASLTRQRVFASPLTVEILGQVQRRATPARGTIDSALGQFQLSLPVSEHVRLYWAYLIQAANISKWAVKPTLGAQNDCGDDGNDPCRPPNRIEAIVPDLTGALEAGVAWQRVDNAFNPDDGFIANLDVLFASPYLGGLDWWVRTEVSWQHFIPIPRTDGRLNFRYSLRYGHAVPLPGLPRSETTSIPEVWRYFGGGTADLGLRGIEPQTMLVDIERLPVGFGAYVLRPQAQGAHIRALGSFALQVVTVRNIFGGKLAHSLFLDVGVLTQRWKDVVPIRDIRRSVGINFIKWDIDIVTVALGYAVLVPNWILRDNVRPTDDHNGRFVFDVGATF